MNRRSAARPGVASRPKRKCPKARDQLDVLSELPRPRRAREQNVCAGATPDRVSVCVHLEQVVTPAGPLSLLLLVLERGLFFDAQAAARSNWELDQSSLYLASK